MRLRLTPKYTATEIKSGVVYERSGMKVTAFEVDHTISPSFGYRGLQQRKPRLAIYSHVILFGGATDDDVLAATRKGYTGPVEMGTELTVIDVGSTIVVRRVNR